MGCSPWSRHPAEWSHGELAGNKIGARLAARTWLRRQKEYQELQGQRGDFQRDKEDWVTCERPLEDRSQHRRRFVFDCVNGFVSTGDVL
ncbi:hypothetical protein NDU88_006069 [Pleurodeles waltl]|uniref:Uncharacterized protein n=1 Tax=Pleurodeles waltl TaxID=8319 RepID=A0AAV7QJS7_PLEWA|nr:hypothetical protein NDU88_006069 [Pleurodeles waltl]